MDKLGILNVEEEFEEFEELVLNNVVPFVYLDGFFEEVEDL